MNGGPIFDAPGDGGAHVRILSSRSTPRHPRAQDTAPRPAQAPRHRPAASAPPDLSVLCGLPGSDAAHRGHARRSSVYLSDNRDRTRKKSRIIDIIRLITDFRRESRRENRCIVGLLRSPAPSFTPPSPVRPLASTDRPRSGRGRGGGAGPLRPPAGVARARSLPDRFISFHPTLTQYLS